MTRFGIDTSSTTSFPTSTMTQLDMQDPLPVPLTPSQQKIRYKVVGAILFLSNRFHPYLSFSVNYLSLFMSKASQHQLDLWCNLLKYIYYSYASHLDRKSHYGISIHMNFDASKIIMWLLQLLLELGFPLTQPTILCEDNKSAIHISENGNDKCRMWGNI